MDTLALGEATRPNEWDLALSMAAILFAMSVALILTPLTLRQSKVPAIQDYFLEKMLVSAPPSRVSGGNIPLIWVTVPSFSLVLLQALGVAAACHASSIAIRFGQRTRNRLAIGLIVATILGMVVTLGSIFWPMMGLETW